jgi:hypothetical protein
MIVIMNCVLLCLSVWENKSYGNRKPFAFILWCTRSCVGHSNQGFKHILTFGVGSTLLNELQQSARYPFHRFLQIVTVCHLLD